MCVCVGGCVCTHTHMYFMCTSVSLSTDLWTDDSLFFPMAVNRSPAGEYGFFKSMPRCGCSWVCVSQAQSDRVRSLRPAVYLQASMIQEDLNPLAAAWYDNTLLSEQVWNLSCIPAALFINFTDIRTGHQKQDIKAGPTIEIKIHKFIITLLQQTTTSTSVHSVWDLVPGSVLGLTGEQKSATFYPFECWNTISPAWW